MNLLPARSGRNFGRAKKSKVETMTAPNPKTMTMER